MLLCECLYEPPSSLPFFVEVTAVLDVVEHI